MARFSKILARKLRAGRTHRPAWTPAARFRGCGLQRRSHKAISQPGRALASRLSLDPTGCVAVHHRAVSPAAENPGTCSMLNQAHISNQDTYYNRERPSIVGLVRVGPHVVLDLGCGAGAV